MHHRVGGAGVVAVAGLEEHAQVAAGGVAQAEHGRVLRQVGQFIDHPRLEAGRQADLLRVGGVGTTAEMPLRGGDGGGRGALAHPHRQCRHHATGQRRTIVGVHRRIAVGDVAGEPAAIEGGAVGRRGDDDLGADAPGDRAAIGVVRHRHLQRHAAVARQHVALPGVPDRGVALFLQPAVAGIGQRVDRRNRPGHVGVEQA